MESNSKMDDLEDYGLEPVLSLHRKALELITKSELSVLRQQISTLKKELLDAKLEMMRIQEENRRFRHISVKGNLMIDNFRKDTHEFLNTEYFSMAKKRLDDVNAHVHKNLQTEITVQSSEQYIEYSISLEEITNKCLLNDLTGYKQLAPVHFISVQDGKIVFDTIDQVDKAGKALGANHRFMSDEYKNENYLQDFYKRRENIYKLVCEEYDSMSSDCESVGNVNKKCDVQSFRKKLYNFCQVFLSTNNSQTSVLELETTTGVQTDTSVQVLYMPTAHLCKPESCPILPKQQLLEVKKLSSSERILEEAYVIRTNREKTLSTISLWSKNLHYQN